MSRRNPFWGFISHNIYWIVIIVGVLLVGVLDENSFLTRIQYSMRISELNEQIDSYTRQYERDEQQLDELSRDPRAITKIAREKYMMKADDEDIFVLSDDETNTEDDNNNESVE